MQLSGKLVVSSIVIIAILGASASWWFRYSATHRAVAFWGPSVVRLIRDAPKVELFQFQSTGDPVNNTELLRFLEAPTNRLDVSTARGLTHLRSALLEDRSYDWPPRPTSPNNRWLWVLVFRNPKTNGAGILLFSPDWQVVTKHGPWERKAGGPIVTRYELIESQVISCEPIAAGLNEMLGGLADKSMTPR